MGCEEKCRAGCEACRREEAYREEAYRVYVTDALYALCGFVGIRLKGRYYDLVRSEGTGNKERTTGSLGSTGSAGAGGMKAALKRLEKMEIEVVR